MPWPVHFYALGSGLLGPLPIVVDNVAQLAWLGAACAASPDPTRHCYTAARIGGIDHNALQYEDLEVSFTITYDHEYVTPSSTHGCWFSLGRNMSIATGFLSWLALKDKGVWKCATK